jgi:hypothetical protein
MDVSKIMSESFDMLLNRDRSLNDLTAKSFELRDGSKNLKDSSRKLKLSFLLRQWMTPIIIALVVILFVVAKVYLF